MILFTRVKPFFSVIDFRLFLRRRALYFTAPKQDFPQSEGYISTSQIPPSKEIPRNSSQPCSTLHYPNITTSRVDSRCLSNSEDVEFHFLPNCQQFHIAMRNRVENPMVLGASLLPEQEYLQFKSLHKIQNRSAPVHSALSQISPLIFYLKMAKS